MKSGIAFSGLLGLLALAACEPGDLTLAVTPVEQMVSKNDWVGAIIIIIVTR